MSTASPEVDARTGPPAPSADISASDPITDDGPAVGRTLRGRYRLVRVVGRGGLGTVYEADDQFRIGAPEERRVALKVLHPALSRQEQTRAALLREFQHVQRLSHPNIVRVHEVDRDGAITFFTMELLSGLTLERVLSARGQARLDPQEALTIVREIGAALAHAHGIGIVHGDVNPHNVFITDASAVRVLDFGSSTTRRAEPWIDDADTPERTRFATLQYASVEVLDGEVPGVSDDLYALACVAYVLLSGRHPFGERTALQARAAGVRPRRPRGLARSQWRALRDGLSLSRDRRPRDVARWTQRLLGDTRPRPLPPLSVLARASRREPASRRRWATGFAVMLLVAIGGWAWRSQGLRWIAATVPPRQVVPRSQGSTPTRQRVPTDAGTSVEPGRQTATAHAREAVAAVVARPPESRAAPIHAQRRTMASIDTGPARIEFAASRVVVVPGDPVARIVVQRIGDVHSAVRFRWRIESGTARRNRDFAVVGATVATIGRGRRSTDLLIPIVVDPTRSLPVSFYVTLSGAGLGDRIGPRTITRVTILPSR